MTKLSRKVLLVALALTLVLTLTLVACKENATVSFVGGDGATGTAPEAINTTVGETIQLPENTFTKQGYVFAGWKNGDTVLQPKATYIVESASVEFTAQWTAEEPEPEVTLTSITATYDGTIELNGMCDNQKMVVTAHYSDGSSHAVSGYVVDIDTSVAGSAQAEITYSEGGVTKTFNLTIEIVAPQPTTYALTYAAGDHGTGTAPAAEQKEANAQVTLAAATLFTAESGYEFDGWSDGTTKYAANATFTMPAKAVTLTAQWKLIKHTVTFNPNNTDEPQTWTVQVNHGETVAKPADDPTMESGKIFRYWTLGGSEYSFENPVTADVTLIAAYAYKITYLAGEGATGTVPEVEWVTMWNPGTLSSLPEATGLSNGNKIFAGWSDGTKVYQVGDAYTSFDNYYTLTNVTFTAVWESNAPTIKYTVTYKAGEHGTGANVTESLEAGKITLKAANTFTAAQGCMFAYWFDGEKVYEAGAEYTLSKNVELVAMWYEVLIDNDESCYLFFSTAINHGYLEIGETKVEYLVFVEGTDITFISYASGAEFVGTYDSNGLVISIKYGMTTYSFGQAQTEPAQKYTVTWIKASDGNLIDSVVGNVPEAQQVAAGGKLTAPAADTLTLAHYTLTSWRVYEFVVPTNGTDAYWDVMYVNDSAVNIAPGAQYTMPAKNIQIKAVWTANTVTISFDANGGSGEIAPVINKQFNSSYFLPQTCAFTAPEGKEFAGWATSENGALLDGGLKLDASVVSAEDTVTLYAIWKSATVVPTTPLIDEIKGAWTATGHTLDIIAYTDDDNQYLKGYAILDGKYLLAIMDNYGEYYASTLDQALVYRSVTLSDGTLTLTVDDDSAIELTNKTELVNAAHSTFEGNWIKNSTTQKWIVTANKVYYGTTDLKAVSTSIVIGNYIAMAYEQSYSICVYVLEKQDDSLVGWFNSDPEKDPDTVTFVAGDYLTLIVDGELNQIVNSGSAPDVDKLTVPEAPEGQVFVKWVIAGTETEFDPTVAMTESVAIEAVYGEGMPASAKTFTGICTVESKVSGVGITVTAITIDFETLKVMYKTSAGETNSATMTVVTANMPTIYGTDAKYYSLSMQSDTPIPVYFVVNAEQTKLTICNSGDTPLNNGEFVLKIEGSGESEYVTVKLADVSDKVFVADSAFYSVTSYGSTTNYTAAKIMYDSNFGSYKIMLLADATKTSGKSYTFPKDGDLLGGDEFAMENGNYTIKFGFKMTDDGKYQLVLISLQHSNGTEYLNGAPVTLEEQA